MVSALLNQAGQTLSPLGSDLNRGLISITVLAMTSFCTTTVIFLYLTYKLVAFHFLVLPDKERDTVHHRAESIKSTQHLQLPEPIHRQNNLHHQSKSSQQTTDFVLGIDGLFSEPEPSAEDSNGRQASAAAASSPAKSPPNQFLILIYNLLLADMHQSAAFMLNATWLRRNGIMVDSATCFAQGFFVSTGDLSSSLFITSIALHTYLSVVRNYRPSQKTLYLSIVAVWLFVYVISLAPIAATRNGAAVGGFFVRAGAWCWMNEEYENTRLLTHYLYIFFGLFATSALYLTIFIHLRRQVQRVRANFTADQIGSSHLHLNHNPAFLIYPIIYVICTLPLALGRIATMAKVDVPISYFCFAGGIIAFNGFFDCLLFGTTRNTIIFASKYEVSAADTGLETFAFLKTPLTRRYGNIIWIQGGRRRKQEDEGNARQWPWQRLVSHPESRYSSKNSRLLSEESLRGQAIQLDMVTSVTVERDHGIGSHRAYLHKTTSGSPSVTSTEKGTIKGL